MEACQKRSKALLRALCSKRDSDARTLGGYISPTRVCESRFPHACQFSCSELISQEVDDADFMWHPASTGTTSYGTASDINTYPTVGGDTYSYNDNGCLEDDDTWAFTYDQDNRLTSTDDGVTTVDFLYDPQNRQVQKAVGASKARFLYAGIQRIADYDENDDLVNRFVYGNGLDQVMLQIAPNGTVTYLHADRLGSIVATSDAGGDNTDKIAYGPFGETDSLSGISHGYTGQRFDSETALYYMKSRYYQSTIGRFHQPDPIGIMGGINLYNYVYNAPLQWTDPVGLRGLNPFELGIYMPTKDSTTSIGGVKFDLNQLRNTLKETAPNVAPGEVFAVITDKGWIFQGAFPGLVLDDRVVSSPLPAQTLWLDTWALSVGAVGTPNIIAHSHDHTFPGGKPYIFSDVDLGKAFPDGWTNQFFPKIIVTTDGLVLYAPKGWMNNRPHGEFDFEGKYHRIKVDENGYEYADLETSTPPVEK